MIHSPMTENNIEYKLIQTPVDGITMYGIKISQTLNDEEYMLQAACVSPNKETAQTLMKTLERCGVGVITFREVMEDYLIDRAKNSIKRL